MGLHKRFCAQWIAVLLVFLLVGCSTPPEGGPPGEPPPETEWEPAPSPPAKPGLPDVQDELPTITGISFVDENHGWMLQEQSILRTRDGGRTWQPLAAVPTTTGLYGLQSRTWDSGWVATEDGLFRTSDGGASWEQLLAKSFLYGHFQFLDEQYGWTKLYPDAFQATQDGGKTWSPVVNPCEEDGVFSFIDPRNGWMLCPMGGGAGIEQKELFRTEDGGATWQFLTRTGSEPNEMPLSSYARDLCFLDDRHGWLSSAKGDLLMTRDGGKRWERLPGMGGDVVDIQFLSPQLGYAVVTESPKGSRLLVTPDGGKSWVQRYASGQN